MAIETETSLGGISFDDGEWDQAAADSDTFTFIHWWMPNSSTAHQTRSVAVNHSGDGTTFEAEYRDNGGAGGVDAVIYTRSRATTPSLAWGDNGSHTLDVWNFTAYVDHGDGAGTDPQLYNGLQTTQVAEVSSYNLRLGGVGALSNSAVSNNSSICYNHKIPGSTGSAFDGRTAWGAMYDTDLSLEQIRAIQFNPWAHIDLCNHMVFLGHHTISNGQVDVVGGFLSTGTVGTATLLNEMPVGVGRFPQLGGIEHSGLSTVASVSSMNTLTLLGVG